MAIMTPMCFNPLYETMGEGVKDVEEELVVVRGREVWSRKVVVGEVKG
jgi:hypothetical protein